MKPAFNKTGRPLLRLLIASSILAAYPAHANDQQEINRLKALIEELDQRVRVLDRKQEIATEEAAARQKSTPTVNASDKGFGFKSADGDFEYKLRGVAHFDYRRFEGDSAASTIYDGFLFRRIRPTFEGTIFKHYGFRFTPEFAESGDGSGTSGISQNKVRVVDAYLDIKHNPAASVRLGKFKPFVGLERLQGAADTKFIERSYVSNNFLPNRDLGVSLFGEVADKKINYAVGIFNGIRDGGENFTSQDENNAKDFTARIFTTPFAGTESKLAGLGVGIAGTWSSATNNALSSYKTPGQAYNFFSYSSTTTSNGSRNRISPQAYYYRGPFGLLAEYATVDQAVIKGASTDKLKNNAWQISTSWLLTGEDASFGGVKPLTPFKPGPDGGWGAVELVARYQENNLDDKASTYADSTRGFATAAKTWGVGLNWYLAQGSKFAVNYDLTTLDNVTTGTVLKGDKEHFLVARYQLAF
ncbi:MAG: OprO/OprP family phosphate-selective porin [Oxalobacteraceae bacterium]|nr:OprO/OprP family phosphate-selective porin [Oxalobacteraceae bacterium]